MISEIVGHVQVSVRKIFIDLISETLFIETDILIFRIEYNNFTQLSQSIKTKRRRKQHTSAFINEQSPFIHVWINRVGFFRLQLYHKHLPK